MENKDKCNYQKPWIEIIELGDDVIQTSGGDSSLPIDYFEKY